MQRFYRFWVPFVISVLAKTLLLAQLPYDDEVCPDKSPRKLKQEEQKKKLLNGLNKTLIYISYASYSDRTVDRPLTGPDEFATYKGKMIRDVSITVLDPYGVSIEKPQSDHFTRFQKFADKIQIKTKDWVVRNDLLFKTGDAVNPILFADTEKNLWERGTFKDVKIFMLPVEGSPELIDILVMVQDKWSWSLNSSLAYDHAYGGIEFQNFMGLPQEIWDGVSINYRTDDPYTLSGGYGFSNIKKSHIDVYAKYTYDNLEKGGKVNVSRDFFSANSKWAGHLQGAFYHESATLPNSLGAEIPTNVTYNWEDLWLARSFKMPGELGDKFDLLRLVVSGRVNRYQYLSRPYLVSPDGSQLFVNRTYALGSIGLANWDYYLDHSVYYLDQAEYFGKGFNPALIFGYDRDEQMGQRFYSGLQMDYGKYFNRVGYADTRISYGGYLTKNEYDQILFKAQENFYSAPVKLGRKFMFRQTLAGTVNLGFNRPSDREIAMNNSNGVRGIFVDYIRGMRSYVANIEEDIYPTFKVLGFTSSVFAFADLAVVQQQALSSFQLSQAYGVGLRLRNMALGLDYFEISFAYYPKLGIPGLKDYNFIGSFFNTRSITQDNLFLPGILTAN